MQFRSFIHAKPHSLIGVCGVAGILQFGVLASSAQTNIYLFTGSETNITLNPGRYNIAAYGAQGGSSYGYTGGHGAQMEAEFDFTTATTLTLLVGGAGWGYFNFSFDGGGGGGSFVVHGSTPLVIAGGGGGATYYVGAGSGLTGTNGGAGTGGYGGSGGTGGNGGGGGGNSANTGYYAGGGGGGFFGNGVAGYGGGGGGGSSFISGGSGGSHGVADGGSPGGYGGGGGGADPGGGGGGGGGGYSGGGGGGYGGGGGGGGSYIDSAAIAVLAEVSGVAAPNGSSNGEIIITALPKPIVLALASTAAGNFGFDITGPTNATIVIEVCTNLANPAWIPVVTNVLSNGTNHFSDVHWANYRYRFYRVSEPQTLNP